MRKSWLVSCLLATAACAGVLLTPTGPARADHSISAGYFAPTPDQKSFGLIGTAGLSLPIVPIAPQIAIALPFSGGRYAITGEARVNYYGTEMGIGAGVARLASHGSSGTIYDAFIARPIAPLTSIEARFYGAGSDRAGSTGYIGLRFGI